MFSNKPKNKRGASGKKTRRGKKKRKHTQDNNEAGDNDSSMTNQNDMHMAQAMAIWSENFTAVTTWQLRYQLDHWRSTALALQKENNILRELIKEHELQQQTKKTDSSTPMKTESQANSEESGDDASDGDDDDESEDDDEGEDNLNTYNSVEKMMI